MNEIYHILLHLSGLCGEAHPSIYTLIVAIIALPFKSIVEYIYDKINI
jgi:hypothetical protein